MNGPSQVPSQASPEQLRDAWLMILSALAAVARADPRPKEADTAAALLFQILTAHAAGFTSALWADIFTFVLGRMLALPDGVPAGEPVASSPDGHPSPSSGLHRRRGAAPLPVSVSAAVSSPEGTARVLRHAAAHLPDLWTFIAAQPGDAAPAATLLPPSLQLLQSYTESADDAAAALGTEQLHSLLAQVGPGLGPHGWDATEGALREMIAVPLIPVTGGNAAAVRRRCRGSLLAMRCVAQSLRESNAAMPAAVQLDLLGALEDAVVKATSLNASPRQRRAMAALLNGGSWEGAMVAVNGAHASAHGPPGDSPREGIEETPDSESGADAVALAGAVRESGADWEAPLLPALARHEVEGGRMLLAALQQCAATPAALDADATDGVRAECERRLVDFALAVVRAAARRISGPDGAPAPAAAGQATWEDSMRAPLVADALRALCALPPGAWAGSKGEVFGLAARLVCSSELAVRKAVQGLMRAQAGAALQAMAK